MQFSSKIWSYRTIHSSTIVTLLLTCLFFNSSSVFDADAACISYSSSSKTITVTCTVPTRLTDVSNVLQNPSVLKKESGGSGPGIWLLAANLVVAKGGNFVIDSIDTTWLKIRSDGSVAFGLQNYGSLSIKSVKITSWNTATNNYGSPDSDGKTPRAYIVAKSGATGKMNIAQSHLAYLGYTGSGHHGLDYYGSDGSTIQDSEIDHNYRAFYSSGVGYITFTRNTVHDNIEYGIDPHSGTHHMYITYNNIYNNNHGIICSVRCSFIQITNNELYNNQRDGIFMNAGSRDSTIADNIIHDEVVGIQLNSLSYSKVYGNEIYNSKYGIDIDTEIGSSFDSDGSCGSIGCVSISNDIHHNTIKASNIGILLQEGASSNTITSNTLDGPNGDRGIVVDGSKTSGNVFSDNHISNTKYPIRLTGGNINSKFINNHLDTVAPSGEYTLAGASWLKVESTQFSSDVIRSLDSTSNKISISKSGTIGVTDGSTTKNYDTNSVTYGKTLASNGKITLTSSSTPPTVTSTTPVHGATGVAVTSYVTGTFSEVVQASTVIPSTFILKNSAGSNIAGAVKLSGDGRTGIFDPTSSLAPSNSYTATVTTGVKDLAGNAMTSAKVWRFTTGTTSSTSALRTDSIISGANSTSGSSIIYDQNNGSSTTEINPFDDGKDSSVPKFADRQSAQQQAKRAQDLAEQQVTSKKEINNESEHSESSNSISEKIRQEQNQTPDKAKPNNDKLPTDQAASNKGSKHRTELTLTLIKEKGDQSYSLAGKIIDRTENRPLQGMPIFFTTDSPIRIEDETTNNEGAFSTNTFNLPSISGMYKFQGHFILDKYGPANSNIVVLKVDEDQSLGRLKPTANQQEVGEKNPPNIGHSERKLSINATTYELE
jgi:mannuronan 5-epimerase